jgi:hypothetical protein
MKINIRKQPEQITLEQFAEKNDLVLEVEPQKDGSFRIFFRGTSMSSFGDTIEEAIENYTSRVSDMNLYLYPFDLNKERLIKIPKLKKG